ncbi:MAG TPA: ATP-grasp domain-containing protein, partial [Coriobacteriia bacterium]|nr:ATP-grasp domain-containing protein [Coriobacteriia bacterium]
PEVWDIQDYLRTEAGATFRCALLDRLSEDSALLAYRPSQFLSAVAFARGGTCLNLSMFGGHQAAFEHKPWVETAVASMRLPRVPWTYVAEEDQSKVREQLRTGPLMVRRSRTSGGEGLVRVESTSELATSWPRGPEGLVSVAPFLEGALPVNVGAVAWEDGVTLHHPSIQLVGLPSCVSRPFGYCGNDFARTKDLDGTVLDEIERSTVAIGDWLRSHGYRGAYGVDYVIHDGHALFMEVNPRFQGSSHASAMLDQRADDPCVFVEHMAAMLGFDAPRSRRLRDLVGTAEPLAHVVVHWTGFGAQQVCAPDLVRAAAMFDAGADVDVAADPAVILHPGAVVARITTRATLTTTGFDLDAGWLRIIEDWNAAQVGREMVIDASHEAPPDPGR